MEGANVFLKRFKIYMLLANLNSVYVPGIKFPKLHCDVLFVYCIIMTIASLNVICDLYWQAIFETLQGTIFFIVVFDGFCFILNSTQRIYFLLVHKKLRKLFETLSACMKPPLWPEIFEDTLKEKYKSIIVVTLVTNIVIVGPMILSSVEKIFIAKSVFYPSVFLGKNLDPYKTRAPLMLLLNESIMVILHNTSWVFAEGIFSLLFKTLQTHLEYLGTSLNKIMSVLQVSDEGVILRGDNMTMPTAEEKKQLMDLTRKRLKLWIKHHTYIIQINHEAHGFLTPVLNLQFGFLTFAMIGLLFASVQGYLPMDIIVLNGVYIGGRMVLTFRLCRCGDIITKKSAELPQSGITGHYTGFDEDIQKTLLKIGEISRRELIGENQTLLPINSQTFMNLIYLQYRFFTFIENTVKNKTKG